MKGFLFLAIGITTISVLFTGFVGLGGVNSMFPTLYFMKFSLSSPSGHSSLSRFLPYSNINFPSAILSKEYKIYLWSYCASSNLSTICTSPRNKFSFDPVEIWQLEREQLPDILLTSLETYSKVSSYIGPLYIAALASTFAALAIGICSMIIPYFPETPFYPFLFSFVACLLLLVASVFATVTFGSLAGAFRTVFRGSGINASLGQDVIIITWIAFGASYVAACLWFVGLIYYICFG